MGEGELKCHRSPLHFRPSASLPLSLHPPSSSALRARARLPPLPAGSEQEGGKAEKQEQGEDTGEAGSGGGPNGWRVYFTVADEFEMPSKKHLIAPSRSLPGKGVWEGMSPRATSVSFDKQLGTRHRGTGCSPVMWGGGPLAPPPRLRTFHLFSPLSLPFLATHGSERASGSKEHFK